MKWRNSKERELLASGGSRDQTLPNKNNPNPDLSDARCDRQHSISPPLSPPDSVNTTNNQPSSSSSQNIKHYVSDGNITNENINRHKYNSSKSPEAVDYENHDMYGYDLEKNQHNIQSGISGGNNFYDNSRKRDNKNDISSNNQAIKSGAGGGLSSNMICVDTSYKSNTYSDEYDSNSDSDEEINVT